MKKTDKDLVEGVINMQKDMNELSVDKINEIAPKQEEKMPVVVLSKKEIAAMEGIQYVEPIRKFQAFGVLPEKWKKERDHDWEYVKGIYENEVVRGDPIRFTFSKWPGDPDCMWEIPSNKPVYVPRMIAKLLSGEKDESTGIQAMQYHSFNHIARAEVNWQKDEFTHQFAATGTYSRGKFRAMGAF
jgi:hypothetical protein